MRHLYRYWLRRNLDKTSLEKSRALVTIAFLLVGLGVCIGFWILATLTPFNVPRQVFVYQAILLTALGYGLIAGRLSRKLVGHFFIVSCWAAFTIGAYYAGGIRSLVVPWLAVPAVMASLTLDTRSSLFWFLITLATIASFIAFDRYLPAVQYTTGISRHIISATGLCVTMYFLTRLYDRARFKLLAALAQKNADLRSRRRLITRQKQEIDDRLRQIAAINLQLEEKVQEIRQRNVTLEQYWNTLLDLSKNRIISLGSIEASVELILKVAAESLRINRVSLWRYFKDPVRLSCINVYDAQRGRYVREDDLLEPINTRYFATIRKEKIIAVDDVRNHEDTAGFVEPYLDPNGIRSMMDAPFFLDGKLAGVLCCESVHDVHPWTPEDKIFTTSLADIIALAYRCSFRNEHERQTRDLNRRISQQNELLLAKTEEIARINQTLEDRVQERTEELTKRSQQLTEYAFINSHSLRGPVARIMGLVEIMELEGSRINLEQFIIHLKDTTIELDTVVRKITEMIEGDDTLTRSNS